MITKKLLTPLVLFFIFLLILLTSYHLTGFLDGHLGWAGPDLLSSSRNIFHTKFLFARFVAPDGVITPYNHHPPLAFYLFALISKLSPTYQLGLSNSYFFATLMTFVGWIHIGKNLHKNGFNKQIVYLSIFLVALAPLFAKFKNLTTFDSFSVLSSSLLFAGIYSFESYANKLTKSKNLQLHIIYFLIPLLISWYSVPVVIFYLGFRSFFPKEVNRMYFIKNLLIYSIAFCSLWIVIFGSIYAAVKDISSVTQFFLVNTNIVQHPQRVFSFFKLTSTLFQHYLDTLLLPTVIIGLTLAFKKGTFHQFTSSIKSSKNQLLIFSSSIFVIVGVFIFIFATPAWSVIHPFAFLLLAAPAANLMALFLNSLNLSYKTMGRSLAAVSFVLFYNYGHSYLKDLESSQNTNFLIQFFDKQIPYGSVIKGPSLIGCSYFSPGALFYFASYPNFTARENLSYDNLVEYNCLDQQKGLMEFKIYSEKKLYLIDLVNKKVVQSDF